MQQVSDLGSPWQHQVEVEGCVVESRHDGSRANREGRTDVLLDLNDASVHQPSIFIVNSTRPREAYVVEGVPVPVDGNGGPREVDPVEASRRQRAGARWFGRRPCALPCVARGPRWAPSPRRRPDRGGPAATCSPAWRRRRVGLIEGRARSRTRASPQGFRGAPPLADAPATRQGTLPFDGVLDPAPYGLDPARCCAGPAGLGGDACADPPAPGAPPR